MSPPSLRMVRKPLFATALAVSTAAFAAEPPLTDVAPVRAAALLSFHCQARALPTQREVGEALGQHNFSQVYASRARLMNEVARACQGPGVERVDVVLQMQAPPRASRYVALQAAGAR